MNIYAEWMDSNGYADSGEGEGGNKKLSSFSSFLSFFVVYGNGIRGKGVWLGISWGGSCSFRSRYCMRYIYSNDPTLTPKIAAEKGKNERKV